MKGVNTKNRPRRLFYDEKKDKYFYLINKKKKYIKVDKNISQKQISKINIKNIIGIPVRTKVVRPRRTIKPILTNQIVSKLVPIAPVSQNLTGQLYTPKDNDKFLERLSKLEEAFKPVDIKTSSKTSNKTSSKIPKPTINKTEEEKAVEKGFTETDANPILEDEGDIIIKESVVKKKNLTIKIKNKLKDIILRETGLGKYNYGEFIDWWNTSSYSVYRQPTFNEYSTYAMDLLPELKGEDKKEQDEFIRQQRIIHMSSKTAGKGSYSNDDDGIYNDELQEIFKDKTNKFLPVIPSDKMDTLIPMVNKNTKKFGWIQNTEPSSSKGRHWVAWFIDIPNLEINYYDSLAENEGLPSKQSLKGLKKIVNKIHPEYYLLLKYNQIREQNPMSKNCGYFSLKFIMDRYRNVPFKTATGYESIYGDEDVVDKYDYGEMKIKRFKNFL